VTAATSRPTQKVLVIDDSQVVRLQVSRVLVTAGYSVIEACDGQDALDKVTSHPELALVLCDINMPRMNGIEFLERLRPRVPVVMLTTEGQLELRQRAKALGAQGWIKKPFKPEHLVETVRKLAAVCGS
jgi:two-component system chemotaxis response regulator CheY